jgi:hypothetical protein
MLDMKENTTSSDSLASSSYPLSAPRSMISFQRLDNFVDWAYLKSCGGVIEAIIDVCQLFVRLDRFVWIGYSERALQNIHASFLKSLRCMFSVPPPVKYTHRHSQKHLFYNIFSFKGTSSTIPTPFMLNQPNCM